MSCKIKAHERLKTSFADRAFFAETGEASFTAVDLCLDPVVGISLA